MNHDLFGRLCAGTIHPFAIGIATFVTTVALVLARPGAGIA